KKAASRVEANSASGGPSGSTRTSKAEPTLVSSRESTTVSASSAEREHRSAAAVGIIHRLRGLPGIPNRAPRAAALGERGRRGRRLTYALRTATRNPFGPADL